MNLKKRQSIYHLEDGHSCPVKNCKRDYISLQNNVVLCHYSNSQSHSCLKSNNLNKEHVFKNVLQHGLK